MTKRELEGARRTVRALLRQLVDQYGRAEVMQVASVSSSCLDNWVTGRSAPSLTNALCLLDGFGINLLSAALSGSRQLRKRKEAAAA